MKKKHFHYFHRNSFCQFNIFNFNIKKNIIIGIMMERIYSLSLINKKTILFKNYHQKLRYKKKIIFLIKKSD